MFKLNYKMCIAMRCLWPVFDVLLPAQQLCKNVGLGALNRTVMTEDLTLIESLYS